jgi:hypothetical protein
MYEKVKIGRGFIIIILCRKTPEKSVICMFVVHCPQLSRSGRSDWPNWHDKSLIMQALLEEDQKPNPVVQRVKVIMSAGLMLVHAHRYIYSSHSEGTV